MIIYRLLQEFALPCKVHETCLRPFLSFLLEKGLLQFPFTLDYRYTKKIIANYSKIKYLFRPVTPTTPLYPWYTLPFSHTQCVFYSTPCQKNVWLLTHPFRFWAKKFLIFCCSLFNRLPNMRTKIFLSVELGSWNKFWCPPPP